MLVGNFELNALSGQQESPQRPLYVLVIVQALQNPKIGTRERLGSDTCPSGPLKRPITCLPILPPLPGTVPFNRAEQAKELRIANF